MPDRVIQVKFTNSLKLHKDPNLYFAQNRE